MAAPTLGIFEDEGQRIPTTIPTGSVVTVVAGEDRETLIGIEWEGRALRVYSHDLKKQAEIVRSARTDD